MKQVKLGIIGCGLMGREFASAASRWCHLTDLDVRGFTPTPQGLADGIQITRCWAQ